MAVRRESVVLDVTDHLTPALIKSGAAAELLKRNLKDLDGTAISGRGVEKVGKDAEITGRKVEDAGRKVDNTSKAFDRGEKSIDKYSGRLGLLAQAAVTIGPALIPIGAGAVPAVAALTAGLGAAAGALGVTLLAVQGLGDGLKAIDAYQLAPTAENLQKMTDELNKLGPAGAEFAVYLDGLEPKLKAVQQVARAGLFPGVEDGIDSVLTRLPQVKTIVGEISTGLGDIAADAGQNLASDKFTPFFDYLQNHAAPIMGEFAQATGNVGEGLANLLVAMDPLTTSFTGGLLKMSQSFAQWSRGLDENQGFQDFLTYVRESGPQVIEFIGSLISSLAGIAQAAAPVGSVVLPILTDLVKVVGAIANSDLGTPIFAGLAALSVYNRALATTAALQKSAFGVGASGGRATGLLGTYGAQLNSAKSALPSASQLGTYLGGLGMSSKSPRFTEELERSRSSVRGFAAEAGKAAAPVALLGVAMSGVSDKAGLSNTTLGAMTGSMAGPWGAAIGASVGLVMDFAAANNDAEAAIKATNAALDSSTASFTDRNNAVASLAAETARQNAAEAAVKDTGWSGIGASLAHPVTGLKTGFDDIFGIDTTGDHLTQALDAANEKLKTSQQSAKGLAAALGMSVGPLDGSAESATRLSDALTAAAPAMQAAKITTAQLDALKSRQDQARHGADDGQKFLTIDPNAANGYDDAIDRIKAKYRELNSVAGRQNAVSDAIKEISDAAVDGVAPVDRLQAALDGLLNPQLDLIQAQDALTSGLRHLGDSLAKNNKTLQGGSDAAIKNRAAVGQQVQGIEGLLTAQAKAGATSGQLSASLAKQRGALIKAGEAAGISKSAMSEYLNEINLTPKFVQTLIKNTADEAKGKAAAYKAFLLGLPKVTTTYIRTVHQDVHQGVSAASSLQDVGPVRRASGGLVTGPGGPRDDVIPALLSNREYVINAAAVARYGVGMFHAINAQRLADGGQPGGNWPGTVLGWDGKPMSVVAKAANDAARGLGGLKGRLDEANKALDKQKQKLDNLRSRESDLASSVTSGLRTDPFAASTGDIYASGATTYDPLGVLRGDIRNAKQYRGLDKRLQKRGLSGAALAAAEAAGLTGLQSLDGLGAGGLRDFERLYNQRQRITGTIGRQSGQAVYGQAVAANTKELRELRASVRHLEGALKAEHKHDRADGKKNSDSNAEHVTNGVNGAATNGGRRRPGGSTRV